MPRKGQHILYRPVPQGFAETFVRVGWQGIEKEVHAHAKTIKRWLVICGYDGLRKARRDYRLGKVHLPETALEKNGVKMNGHSR